MRENTVAAPRAPMEPDDVADAFACLRTILTADMDTACAVADDAGPELDRLLLDVVAGTFVPVTAADDHDGELCEHFVPVPARAHWAAGGGPGRAAVRRRSRRPRPNREVGARG
ncbi:hypothetical protein ACFFSH_04845 [Streptomyces filamentosus]|uniref:Uncharacterized protein n=1 Tax=Streptomyces filamentosus TaxID=67294 RepID=A0A919BWR1_STRFL|nr:hypothetical protein [Streptomyces filamentosus]GHG24044.1 hypothetical protein GCM10017667_69490 [Streptomyces filamentosus]